MTVLEWAFGVAAILGWACAVWERSSRRRQRRLYKRHVARVEAVALDGAREAQLWRERAVDLSQGHQSALARVVAMEALRHAQTEPEVPG